MGWPLGSSLRSSSPPRLSGQSRSKSRRPSMSDARDYGVGRGGARRPVTPASDTDAVAGAAGHPPLGRAVQVKPNLGHPRCTSIWSSGAQPRSHPSAASTWSMRMVGRSSARAWTKPKACRF